MFCGLRLYGELLRAALRAQMQYRASFLTMVLGYFLITVIDFLGIWVLFERFGSIRGWGLAEVALLYAMANISLSLAEVVGSSFHHFGEIIRAGDFDRLLLRPCSTVLQLMGRDLRFDRVGRGLQGLVILVWACSHLGLIAQPERVLFLLFPILSGAALFLGVFVLQALLCFWSTESTEIAHIVLYGGVEVAQYPIDIYRPWFRDFFIYVVPLATLNYFPVLAILPCQAAVGYPLLWLYLSPFLGCVFLGVCLKLWGLGLSAYSSTGS